MKRFDRMMVVSLIVLVVLSSVAFAQTPAPSGTRERTIEDIYLSQAVEIQIIRNQARSGEETTRRLAVQSIRDMVAQKRVDSGNEAVVSILEGMLTMERGVSGANQPNIRRESAELLGLIGGQKAQTALIEAMRNEAEPMVMSEIVYALGRIGSNPSGTISNRILFALHTENMKPTPDPNFAYSALLAIEALSKGPDGLAKTDLLSVLIEVLESNYIRDVKEKAKAIIAQLIK